VPNSFSFHCLHLWIESIKELGGASPPNVDDPTLKKMVLQVILSYGVVAIIVVQLKMHYNKMHTCLSNVFIGF
jgi:hypothetical protein